MYQSNDRYDSHAYIAAEAAETAARLEREADEAHSAWIAAERADCAAIDAAEQAERMPAYTVIEWVDNRWLGIPDGPVTATPFAAATQWARAMGFKGAA